MDLDVVIKELYKNKKDKQLTLWLEELKELRYELKYIKNTILPIKDEKERKDRLENVIERIVNIYG